MGLFNGLMITGGAVMIGSAFLNDTAGVMNGNALPVGLSSGYQIGLGFGMIGAGIAFDQQ